MKTNDYLLLSGTLAYSLLFFEQGSGINFLIFNLVIVALFVIRSRELLVTKKWLLTASLCCVSAVGIVLHTSSLAIFANITGLLILSGLSYNIKTSALFSLLFSCYSTVSVFIQITLDAIQRQSNRVKQASDKRSYRVYTILAVGLVALIFFALYKQANPLFAENTKWINLDFISMNWLLFTLGGFILVYALFYHKTIGMVEEWEQALPITLLNPLTTNVMRFEYERLAGVLLFVLLNLMLLVLNFGDIQTIWFNGVLPKGVSHSDFVHNGVGVLIFSIIIAVGLILYLYRSNFVEVKKSKALNTLIFIWILQNLVMLYSTACRNHFYIHDYNLTYKRIGVYVWLCMAVFGLAILFWQIKKQKSGWYLLKTNFGLWFMVVSLSALVNWDLVITRFNLSNKPIKEVDLFYLVHLSDSVIPDLIQVVKNKSLDEKKETGNKAYEHYYGNNYQRDFKTALTEKITHYANNRHTGWQSWNYRNRAIDEAIVKLTTKNKK